MNNMNDDYSREMMKAMEHLANNPETSVDISDGTRLAVVTLYPFGYVHSDEATRLRGQSGTWRAGK